MNAQQFRRATGHKPVQDDLQRVNCTDAGQIGHWQCGLNRHGAPNFSGAECPPRRPRPLTTQGLNLRRKRAYWGHCSRRWQQSNLRLYSAMFDLGYVAFSRKRGWLMPQEQVL